MLTEDRILSRIEVPAKVLGSNLLATMGLSVNKLLIL